MSRNLAAVSKDFTVCPVLQSEYGARLVTGRGRAEAAKKEEEERHQRSLLNTFPFNRLVHHEKYYLFYYKNKNKNKNKNENENKNKNENENENEE